MARDQDRPDDDGDDHDGRAEARRQEAARRRGKFRLIQVALYLGTSIGVPIYAWKFTNQRGGLEMLTYLLSFYLFVRAIAIFVKYRQETRPARYSKAWVEAHPDTLPSTDDVENVPGNGTKGTKHG